MNSTLAPAKRPIDGPHALHPFIAKKPRRELHYEKCQFCRRDKKKCAPEQRQWPGDKCQRCVEKGFACSAPTRAGNAKRLSPAIEAQVIASSADQNEIPDPQNVGDLLDQCHWLQQQLRVVKEYRDTKRGYIGWDGQLGFDNKIAYVNAARTETISEITYACRLLREKRPMEAILLFQLLSNDCQPSQSLWFPTFDRFKIEPVSDYINDLYNVGALGIAESMQETLLSKLIDNCMDTYVIERETDKLIKLNHEYSEKVPRILTKFNLPPSLALHPTPLLHRQSILRGGTCVRRIIAKGYQTPGQTDCLGRTALHQFFAHHDPDFSVFTQLLVWQVPVNDKDIFGRSALHVASLSGGSMQCIKQLLQDGKSEVDVSSKDKRHRSPLSYAAELGNDAVVKLLLDMGKVDVNSTDKHRWTPLSYAARNGHDAIVKLLLDTGKVDVNSKTSFGDTPLSFAAENGHNTVVKLLLDTGKVDIDSKTSHGAYFGVTPLSFAAEYGHNAIVKLLLDTGKVDINSKTSFGETPLSLAAENGHDVAVKLLLDTGKVDVDSKNFHDETPVSFAAKNGHNMIVRLLLDSGRVDADSKSSYGETPLSLAAANGHDTVVKLLLGTGRVDADQKTSSGRTPLSLAAANGHDTVVKLLLGMGRVDADQKTSSGRTPLSYAAGNGHDAVVKLLLDTGKVDVDSKSSYGETPVSLAAKDGHDAIVKLLRGAGKAKVSLGNIFFD